MLLSARARACLAAVAVAASLLSRPAAAETKAECISAYTSCQVLRQKSQLLAARKQLLLCLQDTCPELLRRDCSRWLSEVRQLIPTIVLGAHDRSSRDLVNVSVTLDGRPLTQRLDGKPIAVDPGVHMLRFEAAGRVTRSLQFVAREGQKARAIVVTLERRAAPASRAPVVPSRAPERSSGIPPSVLVFGGVAVVSLGAFGYFGATGLSRWDKCHDGGCTAADASYVNARWVGADVALGLAVVSAGLATWFYLSRDHSPSAPRIGLAPGAAMARLSF